jgi:hypothetical protein
MTANTRLHSRRRETRQRRCDLKPIPPSTPVPADARRGFAAPIRPVSVSMMPGSSASCANSGLG